MIGALGGGLGNLGRFLAQKGISGAASGIRGAGMAGKAGLKALGNPYVAGGLTGASLNEMMQDDPYEKIGADIGGRLREFGDDASDELSELLERLGLG